ncbi:hypothetical protein DPEC_G00355810 [Dallia pectoralis]|uniref:Uncharacterized protein n=1 Tax=Dallia pectoralis TaxID=75939 RepID=A0ACC2EZK3_DALPE|nr:hypothetical protein DPEC_G00355810 [Dallia pectoralis]
MAVSPHSPTYHSPAPPDPPTTSATPLTVTHIITPRSPVGPGDPVSQDSTDRIGYFRETLVMATPSSLPRHRCVSEVSEKVKSRTWRANTA